MLSTSNDMSQNMKLDDGLKRDSSKETDTSSFKKILELTLEKQKVIDKRYNDAVYKNELLEKRIKKHEDGEKSTNKDFLILKVSWRLLNVKIMYTLYTTVGQDIFANMIFSQILRFV